MLPNVSVLPTASLVQKHLLPSQPERLTIIANLAVDVYGPGSGRLFRALA